MRAIRFNNERFTVIYLTELFCLRAINRRSCGYAFPVSQVFRAEWLTARRRDGGAMQANISPEQQSGTMSVLEASK